jgi:hypothetical protein
MYSENDQSGPLTLSTLNNFFQLHASIQMKRGYNPIWVRLGKDLPNRLALLGQILTKSWIVLGQHGQ